MTAASQRSTTVKRALTHSVSSAVAPVAAAPSAEEGDDGTDDRPSPENSASATTRASPKMTRRSAPHGKRQCGDHRFIESGLELDHELRRPGTGGLHVACQRECSGPQVHGEQRLTGLGRGIDRSGDVLDVGVIERGGVGHRDDGLRNPIDAELVATWTLPGLHQLRLAIVEREREHPVFPWHPSILDRARPVGDREYP